MFAIILGIIVLILLVAMVASYISYDIRATRMREEYIKEMEDKQRIAKEIPMAAPDFTLSELEEARILIQRMGEISER